MALSDFIKNIPSSYYRDSEGNLVQRPSALQMENPKQFGSWQEAYGGEVESAMFQPDDLYGLGIPKLAMFIGMKGLKKLGINAEKDLAGQFSGLWDKQVRAELDETGSKLVDFPTGRTEYPMQNFMPEAETYKAYPDTKNIWTSRAEGTASYSPTDDSIKLSDAFGFKPAQKSTQQHELQHAIQEREGFARGGSPSQLSWASTEQRPDLISIANQTMDEWQPATYKQFWGDEVTKEGETAYKKYVKEFNTPKAKNERWRAAQESAPQKAYTNLAGEWEARNAGARAILPADDPRLGLPMTNKGVTFRAGKPFSTADDIALKDFIVRMNE